MEKNKYLLKMDEIMLKNKYSRLYLAICTRAQQRASSRKNAKEILGYTECHHILPKSFRLGGIVEKENKSYLTAKEHYIVHHLLIKCFEKYDHRYKLMLAAFTALTFWVGPDHCRRKFTARQVDFLKKELSKIKTGKSTVLRGKTYEQIHGIEKATELKELRSKKFTSIRKTFVPWNKGRKNLQTPYQSKFAIFVDPDGKIHEFSSIKAGCIKFNLSRSSMTNINKGRCQYFKGWTLKNPDIEYIRTKNKIFIDPSGLEFTHSNIRSGCIFHKISETGMYNVNIGRQKSTGSGWTLKNPDKKYSRNNRKS